ncbi:small secreted hydrophilic protein [Streptomyces cahuitamycinicus]|uniref:Small secreted hydrophilic protein n=1 Tax=Streptomyces cahuitamycinicus TaxID=2070367 RepID=A0A2N8TGJ0_9ACTN|nr:small secreted hydrophilic protein [Streptomyces cahuitamycinicus]PNG18128.1 small secreted hydrophilic protein [Streptomyces cahuitamycinicus]
MAFTRRMAALSAVVLIPLGIAATSFALSDRPESPKVPSKVVLDSESPKPKPTPTKPTPDPSPDDEVVPRQPVTDSPTMDDDDDDGQGAGDDGPDDGGDDGGDDTN